MNAIQELISKSIDNFENPAINFSIAEEYEKLGQTAAALSFYLRAAEFGYTDYPFITYTSILKAGLCLEKQGNRNVSSSNNFYQAIAFMPDRPEAYYLLSRFYERTNDWHKAYVFACAGLAVSGKLMQPLPGNVEYPGEYCLLFEKAVVAWWIGRKDESIEIFNALGNMALDPVHTEAVRNNLNMLQG